MDCTQTRSYLHGHLDRELDPVTATAIERHLQTCGACTQVYARHSSLKAAVRRQTDYHEAPGDLAVRIRAKVIAANGDRVIKKSTPRWQWFQLGAAPYLA